MPEIHPDELSLEQKDEEEKENFNARKYFKETQAIEKGLDGIRVTVCKIISALLYHRAQNLNCGKL